MKPVSLSTVTRYWGLKFLNYGMEEMLTVFCHVDILTCIYIHMGQSKTSLRVNRTANYSRSKLEKMPTNTYIAILKHTASPKKVYARYMMTIAVTAYAAKNSNVETNASARMFVPSMDNVASSSPKINHP